MDKVSENLTENCVQMKIVTQEKKLCPGWYRATLCFDGRSEESLTLLRLSIRMKEEFSKDGDQYFHPKEGEFTAVFVLEAHEWYRGYVLNIAKVETCEQYTVFMIDHGYERDLYYSPRYFRPLPSWFSTEVLPSQSFKVALYGLVPQTEEIQLKQKTTPEMKIVNTWTPHHINFMTSIIKCADSIFFRLLFEHEEIKFGDIIVQNGDKYVKLHEELIKAGYAKSCEECELNFRQDLMVRVVSRMRREQEFDNVQTVRKSLYPHLPIKIENEEKDAVTGSKVLTEEFKLHDVPTRRQKIKNKKKRCFSIESSKSNYSSSNSISLTVSSSDDSFEQSKIESMPLNTFKETKDNEIEEDSIENFNSMAQAESLEYENFIHPEDSSFSRENSITDDNSNSAVESKFLSENCISGLEPLSTDFENDEILVVASGECDFRPIPSLQNSCLDGITIEMLRKICMKDINRCQKFAIPALLTRKNVVLVDAPESGKTVGCLIPLISMLRRTNDNKVPGVSPRSLIICPYSSQCEKIYDDCIRIVTGSNVFNENQPEPDLRINLAYGCGKELEKQKLYELTAGYDVLVCTPRLLLRLLEKEAFDLKRLEHVVFDEFHVLFESYHKELFSIIHSIRKERKNKVQQVIISDKWIPEIKKFVPDSDLFGLQNILLISCYFEAFRFARVFYSLEFLLSEEDICRNILDLLRSETRGKSVVIVSNEDEIEMMYDRLRRQEKRPLYKICSLTFLDHELRAQFSEDTRAGRGPVLLCTDYTLYGLKIYEADFLIHHSLPTVKTDFNIRFCALLHRFQKVVDAMTNECNSTKAVVKPKVKIYMNRSNHVQFVNLIDIMKALGGKIPDEVSKIAEDVTYQREYNKDTEICISMKQFGKCAKARKCKYRHILRADKDLPCPSLPQNGQVRVLITHVYSPVHFRVRLMEHKNEKEEWSPIYTPNIALKMKAYFRKNEPRLFVCQKEGELAALDVSAGLGKCYERVKVLKFIGFRTRNELDGSTTQVPITALLKFIDSGKELVKPLCSLVQLPSELASIPETSVDVFVCNLIPVDEDITWGNKFTNLMRKGIVDVMKKEEQIKFIGEVQLVIGRCIWLDPFHSYCYSELLKTDVRSSFSVSHYLLTEKLALRNPNHLKILREKFEKINLRLTRDQSGTIIDQTSLKNGSSITIEENPVIYSKKILQEKEEAESSSTESSSGRLNTIALMKDRQGVFMESQKTRSSNIAEDFEAAHLNGETNVSDTPQENEEVEDETQSLNNNMPLKFETAELQKMQITSTRDNSVLTPRVYWKQDKDYIYLIIHVNADDYQFTTRDMNKILFEANLGQSTYRLEETLLGRFIADKVHHSKSGVEIRVRLPKLSKDITWSRLLRSRVVPNWLKREYTDDSESDDCSRKTRDYAPTPDFDRSNPNPTVQNLQYFDRRPDSCSEESYSDADSELGQRTYDDYD